MVELENLPKYSGSTTPGNAPTLWLCPIEWIDAFPGPPDPAGPGESLKIGGDITVKEPLTQGFIKVYVTPKTAKSSMELMGQHDSKSFDQKFELFRPGMDFPWIEQLIADRPFIGIYQPPNCGDNIRFVIGQPCNAAYLGGSYESGTLGEESRNGWTSMLSAYGDSIRYLDFSTNPFPVKPE